MYYIIVNPASKSGRGAKIWEEIEPVLLKRAIPYKVYFSKKAGDVANETKRLSQLNEPINLIILGGDGTMNEAVQGMNPLSNFTVGYIPTGSSNDLARNLKIPKEPLLALEKILDGESTVLMDIGLLQYESIPPQATRLEELGTSRSRRFVVSCGIGFDAAVCAESVSSSIKKFCNQIGLGKLTYMGIALKQLLTAPKTSCELWLDDSTEPIYLDKFIFVASMNHRFEGGGFMFCPDADYTDNILDLCVVGNVSKPTILCALPFAFKGQHYRFKNVDAKRASKVKIRTGSPMWVHTDGESKTQADCICITLANDKLRIIC